MAPTDRQPDPNGQWEGPRPGGSLQHGPASLALGSPVQGGAEGRTPPPSTCWQCLLPWASPLAPGLQLHLVPLLTTLWAWLVSHFLPTSPSPQPAHAASASPWDYSGRRCGKPSSRLGGQWPPHSSRLPSQSFPHRRLLGGASRVSPADSMLTPGSNDLRSFLFLGHAVAFPAPP